LARQPLLLLDVGGGSTEFILGQGERKHFRESFRLGAVRLMEQLPPGDPPAPGQLTACRQWLANFLEQRVRPRLDPALRRERNLNAGQPVQLVGTGGSGTIMARMAEHMDDFDRKRIESVRLTLGQIRARVEELWGMPLSERKKMAGLPPQRADIILTGVVIYEAVMTAFQFDLLRVSTRGLRFAAVMESHP
jgi:exopolyphosphatase/guanosine-5'-triphosphate,3'-diphosphate pyrophosphatase